MRVVIAYDGSDYAKAAVDDLRRSGMPRHADALVISVGETLLPTPSSAAMGGAILTPKYHGLAQVEVFGERADGQLIAPLRRPAPNSPVFTLDDNDVAAVLGLNASPEDRPFRLGLLDGPTSLPVTVPAARKSVLFKHVAILGTTGGGKSTTVSGAIASLSAQGNAVVLFDVEGEYVTMNQAADAPAMVTALRRRGIDPRAAERTRLFVLAGRDTANPRHPDIRRFKLGFSDISPFVLVEIMDLSPAQERRFHDAYEACRIVMERARIYPANADEQQEAVEIDELDTGWPRMTLPMILDVVAAGIHYSDDTLDEYVPRSEALREHKDVIVATLKSRKVEKDSRSWKVIAKRLWRMHKAGVFSANTNELIQPLSATYVDRGHKISTHRAFKAGRSQDDVLRLRPGFLGAKVARGTHLEAEERFVMTASIVNAIATQPLILLTQ